MNELPDAPWIRDAEMNGLPADDPVKCPVCGEECERIYVDMSGEAIGCDQCVGVYDAYDWQEEQRSDDW